MFAHLAELPVAEAPRVSPARIRSAHWQTAVTVLDKIWDGRQAADAALQAWFRDHRQMGGRDRANVTMLVYGVLRDAMRLRRIAGDAAPVELLLVMHALLAGTLDLKALRALAGPMADAADAQLEAFDRSEERRVGKECVSPCKPQGEPD